MLDQIWFTYKARIRAQERLAQNDLHSQALLVWYALLGTGIALFTIRYPKLLGNDTDVISAVFSVAILVISMLVTNRDYRGRSLEMRKNYQAIHELYGRASDQSKNSVISEEIQNEYHKLLAAVENHASIDDAYFRVLHNGTLSSRAPTLQEKVEVYAYLSSRAAVLALLYFGPIAALVVILTN